MATVSSEPAPAPVRMDGFEIEYYNWEYWGVAKYKHDAPECNLQYHSAAARGFCLETEISTKLVGIRQFAANDG